MPLWTPSTTSAQPTMPSAPSLNSFQFEINSANGFLKIGPGTPYVITDITGLGDLPAMRSGDTPRPQAFGQFAGFDYPDGRDIKISLWVSSQYAGGTPIQTLLADLAEITVPAYNVESPLWFQFPSMPAMALVCRPRKKSAPMNKDWANSGVATVDLEFHATDPRCYTADSPTSLSFSSSTGALVFPFTSPLTFTGTTVSGSVTNNGTVGADALIELTGTSQNAFVADTSTNQAIALTDPVSGAGTLNSGDVLWIDTFAKSIIYWPNGATVGQRQRGWLEAGSAWFGLPPGTASFEIGALSSSGATCVIHSPSPYMP